MLILYEFYANLNRSIAVYSSQINIERTTEIFSMLQLFVNGDVRNSMPLCGWFSCLRANFMKKREYVE